MQNGKLACGVSSVTDGAGLVLGMNLRMERTNFLKLFCLAHQYPGGLRHRLNHQAFGHNGKARKMVVEVLLG